MTEFIAVIRGYYRETGISFVQHISCTPGSDVWAKITSDKVVHCITGPSMVLYKNKVSLNNVVYENYYKDGVYGDFGGIIYQEFYANGNVKYQTIRRFDEHESVNGYDYNQSFFANGNVKSFSYNKMKNGVLTTVVREFYKDGSLKYEHDRQNSNTSECSYYKIGKIKRIKTIDLAIDEEIYEKRIAYDSQDEVIKTQYLLHKRIVARSLEEFQNFLML